MPKQELSLFFSGLQDGSRVLEVGTGTLLEASWVLQRVPQPLPGVDGDAHGLPAVVRAIASFTSRPSSMTAIA